MVEKHGSNIWFELSDEDLCERLSLPKTWKKGKDTLDVWIDSGSSHMAVMDSRPGLDAPADLYLEATDQHRGWFQSSLMLSVAWRGKAPYRDDPRLRRGQGHRKKNLQIRRQERQTH